MLRENKQNLISCSHPKTGFTPLKKIPKLPAERIVVARARGLMSCEKSQTGFTLLGVIFSLFLVTVGIVGFADLFRALEAMSVNNKNDLTANFLAQEGIEIVRRNREGSNKDNWDSWYASLSDGDYNVEYSNANLEPYSDILIKRDPVTLAYNYSTGDNTIFYRRITLQKQSTVDVLVTCTINWSFKGQSYSLVVQDDLYNWR